ncbi:hypothetical protein BKA70DRAFT_14061 [Coprinopsis sp. MPI-PUGE-AT-0042]|nr:hypothetical protein BKA70DRAFT_14061 [Coprinopsis sp. MPI-PUGE-AT-0042]
MLPPARFSHPTRYAIMLAHSIDSGSSTIYIDAPKAIERLILGDIEVKNPRILQDLLANRLKVQDWNVVLSFDWRWKIRALRRLAFWISEVQVSSPLQADCMIDLDYIPSKDLVARLRPAFQASGSREQLRIEYTSINPSLGFYRTQYQFCLLLFSDSLGPPNRPRIFDRERATPRHWSRILSVAAERPINHEDIVDISIARAKALDTWAHEITHNSDLRAKYIATHGLPAWTKRRVQRECEAVLLKLGVLQRWRVVLETLKD